MNHSKSTATFFSLVPGAGHMYLGLMRQGIELMFLFFFTISVSTTFHLGVFSILIPIIWFYSIFDVRNKASRNETLEDTDLPIFKSTNLNKALKSNNSAKYVAYIFVLLGFLSLMDNVIIPLLDTYIDYQILRYSKSVLISILFIIVGIFIIIKSKKAKIGDKECIKEE
ncbi:hypothetical protein BJV85_003446 [Clostridium acetobutylicum]|uniref:Predicted membrane protein n=1 Tax=Clostridium acetobutylicum (strain ATCC 824 / DSM 792 / JCM 1419 / IAM 19013 / LMG 5710 / NBRC 13948 / NRRL B-527 / VKM B-1787 / 2291 / W) TaxID=272562 RepID=Q97LJ7_CLOAB|nr:MULTISPECIES: hypothetical protein [Clostridium]AAK78542.1 Predicted membrane protein [Clostridium acetobutylicum ATCC 824]ADZ19616.1 membrane protein [Clostridium acetobutylicum EA 2018]AEI31313.1 hypothetical protein SMB_G0576 [Clostridium acetobutylicum DSM 1731]AWV80265.1 hypothetical protein DK921_09190 [Clostridium acetobutylicum]MBC2392450.1 hypothetical protein [Clostridium acetobutylicum]